MGQLKDVLITEQLSRRPARPTDYEALCEALLTLSRVMADAPEKVLQRVAETAMELCRAETAGISLLEEQPGGEFVFRWHAIAGKFSAHLRGMAPRDFSPCGIVVDSGQPQLFLDPARCFPYLAEAQPKIKESLLVPFFINGKPVGTLWLMSHNDQHMFDAEDVRIISKLGEFCSGALQVVHSLQGDAPTSLVADKLIGQQPAVHEAQLKREQLLQSQLGVAQREIERRFHLVVQNLTDYAIMMLDLEGHVTAWNEGARRIKHYTEQEIVGQHFSIFYPPEELAVGRPQQEMATARSTGRSEVEGFRVRKNGERFWCNEIVTTVHDDKGTLVGFAKISR
ncbi:MAG TPA: GAF domain-containing protein, partial [Tepidisphaeraceae bacterium]